MYTIREVGTTPEAIRAYAQLIATCFPGAHFIGEDYLRWQYVENPHGPVVGFDALCGDVPVAHYVMIPMAACIDGHVERGMFSLNSATHPDHRGKGLFDKLSAATHARAAELGFGFAWGTSNDFSTRGALKLGFRFAGRMRAMIALGPVRRRSGVALRYEAAWTPETLAWRLRRPGARYGARQMADGTTRIYAPSGKPGLSAWLGSVELAPELPRARRGPLTVWLGVDPALDWSRALHIDLPLRLRPAPLNLMFKDFTGRGRELDLATTRVQVLDFDAF